MTIEAWADRCRTIQRVARTPRADLLLRYFDIREASNVYDARWQQFQLDVLNNTSTMSIMNKARQIGASFIASGDALGECMIIPHHTIITISFNLEEAKEKIRYITEWWNSRNPEPSSVPARDEFDEAGIHQGISPYRLTEWPEIVKANALEIEWSNGSRFISHPCRPPRGKRASVKLDEFAHYQRPAEIYQAAVPMITRGRGQNKIDIYSTPKGASGKFHEIFADTEGYPDYVRFNYGWWEIDILCPTKFRLGCLHDYLNGTSQWELVQKYGTEHAHFIWNNTNPKEDFYQEYCLKFLDSSYSYITWALIRSCHPKLWSDHENELSEEEQEELAQKSLDTGYKNEYLHWVARCEGVDGDQETSDQDTIQPALDAIYEIAEAIRSGDLKGEFYWAYDCGRDNDASEITLLQRDGNKVKQRLLITMAQIRFPDQRVVIKALLESIPISGGLLDKGSVGRDLAEWAVETWGDQIAKPVWFTPDSKDRWAKSLKRMMESNRLTIMDLKEQDHQLHSIQRVAHGKIFTYEVNEDSVDIKGRRIKHHADKFWVLAMATWLAEQSMGESGPVDLAVTDPRGGVKEAMATVSGLGYPVSVQPSRVREAMAGVGWRD